MLRWEFVIDDKARHTPCDLFVRQSDATNLTLSGLCSMPIDSIYICCLQIKLDSQKIQRGEFYAVRFTIQFQLNEIWPVVTAYGISLEWHWCVASLT